MNSSLVGIDRPSRDETLMQVAQVIAERATCSRAQVGVVIARDSRILTTGYNGAPSGLDHCTHECNCSFPGEGGLLFENSHLSTCSSIQPCQRAVHAEANALAYAARYGIRVSGSTLYTTLMPCLTCAQLIINSGIKRVVAHDQYRTAEGPELLQAASIQVDHA